MPETKRKIRFVQNRQVKDHTGAVIDSFKAGQVFTVGDGPKDMAPDSARHWEHRGVAVEVLPPAKNVPSPAPSAQRPEGDDLTAEILSKIDALDESEDFTHAGVPSVPALTRALGYDISAAERDAAWVRYQEQNAPAKDPGGKTGAFI